MGSVGKVAFVAILGLGAITGVLVYFIFGNAAPAPGVIESIYRQNLPATDGATQDTSQSSSEGANSTSANSTSAAPSAPPSAASGEAWPMERPDVPPEKRPSVSNAQLLPSPFDFR